MISQAERAEQLRALHHAPQPLVLVNAWDAVSARIIESCGFPAIATTSAGIANLEGFSDGAYLDRNSMLAGVARVVRAVNVPVTADMENGYGPTVGDAIATAHGVIDAGAVGLNFEDSVSDGREPLIDTQAQAERIRAIRKVAQERGVPLVINARTDMYLKKVGDSGARLGATLQRTRAYVAAGADCIFVPLVADAATIRELVLHAGAPLNILVREESLPIGELARLGVRRMSLGGWPHGHTMLALRRFAEGVRDHPEDAIAAERTPLIDLNALFDRY